MKRMVAGKSTSLIAVACVVASCLSGLARIAAQDAAPTPESPAPAPVPVPVPAPDHDEDHDEPGDEDADETAEYEAVAIVPSGARQAEERVARNVQRIDRSQLQAGNALGVHGALSRHIGGVVLNDVQVNPLQPDVQYRGFTASPLLGTPQGLVVYQNGVRLNDAFGDVMQWDLVPDFAIDELQLLPGPSPLYGLNALGGGIALQMKDGFRAPGPRIEARAGSFGRHQLTAEVGHVFDSGASQTERALYAGVSLFGEQGFRDASPSAARHLYADLRQRGPGHEVGVDVTVADTDLDGNGPAPVELLAQRRAAVFTFPDNTRNRMLTVSADADHAVTSAFTLSGVAYFRHLARSTLNGDELEVEPCEDDPFLVCDEDGEVLSTEAGTPVAAVDPLYDGVFNTTETTSDGFGATLSGHLDTPLAGRPNQLLVGAGYDGAAVAFSQHAELGYVTDERSVIPEDVSVSNDGRRTELDVDTRHARLFAADTFTPIDPLSIELAGHFSVSNLELTDRRGDALDGDHTFARVNPSLGVTFHPLPAVTLFASYGESSRAPSAVELACADPEEPCRVPNAFLTDPPLEQVVTRAIELGLRGRALGTEARPALRWSLSGFGSRNFDDILFVAGARVGTGYFRNAGETQRIGLEAALDARAGPVRARASYALLRATFEDALSLTSLAHPLADGDGVIAVEPGDRIPGLPTHSFKAGVDVAPLPGAELGLSLHAQNAQRFRGDESNQLDAVDSFATLGAHASYWLFPELQLFVEAQNLLDTEYETFGVLGDPSDVLEGAEDPRFVSPGPPLGVWAGVVLLGL